MMTVGLQLVGEQADYLVKVEAPIFGNFLAAADRTLHKLLAMFSTLTA